MQKTIVAISTCPSLLADGNLSTFLAIIQGEANTGRVKKPPNNE